MVLGRQMQQLRERAGLSFEDAARLVTSTHYSIRRIEKGEVGLNLVKIRALLGHYGITDQNEIETFLALAKEANTPGWWHSYTDVLPAWFTGYIGLEEAASVIRGYEPHLIPGLMQTADYARAVIRVDHPHWAEDEVERLVEVRLARQALLTRTDPPAPQIWFVLDETVLRRPAAAPKLMRPQVERLLEIGDLPNVTVQVLPFAAGLHPAMYGMAILFRYPFPELPDIVYSENLTSATYLDKPEDVAAYVEALDRMSTQATNPKQTRTLLTALHKEMTR